MKRKMLSPFTRLKAKFRDRQGGFTLFEVVLVLILITVLTAVVVSRNSPAASPERMPEELQPYWQRLQARPAFQVAKAA